MSFEELAAKEFNEVAALKDKDMSEEERNKIAADKMKLVVSKMITEEGSKKAQEYEDVVQLGVEGWKMRYYNAKFHVENSDFEEFV